MATTQELERFISDFEVRMAPLEKAAEEAWWNLATSGTEEARDEFVRAGKEYNGLFSDQDEYRDLRNYYENLDALGSPLLRRQVEVLYRALAERQGDREILGRIEELEAEANAEYGNHRSVVRNREMAENEVRELLRTSTDQDLRRETWEASKSVGSAVEETVRELAHLRNRLAREQGVRELLRPLPGTAGDRYLRARRDHWPARVGDHVMGTRRHPRSLIETRRDEPAMNLPEPRHGEVRRIPLLRGSVNKEQWKGRAA